jgi:hypothetical protein
LKSDPNFAYAQAGMLESLKATNLAYKLFLKYSFWMGNLTSKYQWGVIIGFYFGVKGLRILAENNEALQPFLVPLIVILSLVAFSTWVMRPISNLFLRFNRYGQLLLSKDEKMSSNFVAISLGIFVLSIVLYFSSSEELFLIVAAFGFAMMLPYSLMFSPSKYKHAFLIYSIAMTVVGMLAIGLAFLEKEIFNTMSMIFIFGFIGFQWIANFLLIKEDNR